MKIIRTFISTDASNSVLDGVDLCQKELRVKPNLEFGTVTYPLVNPLLATRFFGFQLDPSALEEAVQVAVWGTHGGQSGYFAFDSGRWSLVDAPIYHSIDEMRQAIAHWMGAIKIILKILPGTGVRELSFGYEVNIEIIEYLLRFAVPKYLRRDYTVAFISSSNTLGQVHLPEGFTAESVKDLKVQFLGELPKPASLNSSIITPSGTVPNKELQVIFNTLPLVEFTRGLYQIEQVPSIVIRELPVQNYISTYRSDFIKAEGNAIEVDSPFASFDMPLEVLVMASTMSTAKAIAKQMVSNIKQDGKIHIPPIDMFVGCLVLGSRESEPLNFEGGEGNDSVGGIKGKLATVIVKICLKRLDF